MMLAGKAALITGAARGIGRAIAERYVREGARVAVSDINEAAAQGAARAIGEGAVALPLDVTRQESIDAAIAGTVSAFGRLDILVNNAGIFDLAPIAEITRESYRRVYAVNVEGLLFTLQAGARQMIAQGHGGKIINFASQAGRRGEALVAVYCSSKAAVISLTQSAGLDLIKHGINVNAIAPGYIETNNTEALRADPDRSRAILDRIPAGRWGRPEDIGQTAVFLSAPASDYINGAVLNVDGGWLAR